jgi:hypothetical protein
LVFKDAGREYPCWASAKDVDVDEARSGWSR